MNSLTTSPQPAPVVKANGAVPGVGDIVTVRKSDGSTGRYSIVTIGNQHPKVEYLGVPLDAIGQPIGASEKFTLDDIVSVEEP